MSPDEEIRAIRAELTRRGVLKVSGGDAFARGALDGVSFGFADEIGGAFGGAQVRDRMREELALAQRDRPVTTFMGGMAGGLVPGLGVAGGVARGARLAGAGLRAGSYLGGATVGGLYGAGSGTDTGSRALGTVLGAGLGVGGTAAGEGLGYLGAMATGGRDPTVQAARLAQRALGRTQITEADMAARLRAQGMNVSAARAQARAAAESGSLPTFEADDLVRRANAAQAEGGANGDMLMDVGPYKIDARAVRSVGGPGQSIVDNALNARRSTLTTDVLDQANRTFRTTQRTTARTGRARNAKVSVNEPPPPSGYEEFLSNLEAARRGDAAVDYAAAYAEKPGQEAVRLNLEPLMREGRPEAASHALDLVREEQRTITADLARARMAPNVNNAHIASLDEALTGMRNAERQLSAIANGSPVKEIGAQAVDYYQRGLRALEEAARPGTEAYRSAAAYRRAFNELSDQLYPALGKARSSYAQKIDLREKVDAGRNFFGLPETKQNDLLRSASSPEQHDAIMVGVLEAVEDAISKGDARAVLAMARKPAFIQALKKTARNKAAGDRLVALIRRKANQQFNANEIQGGSSTAPTQEAIRDLTDGGGEAGLIMDFIQAGGDPQAIGGKLLAQMWDNIQRPGIRNPEVSREYARILTQRLTAPQMKLFAQRIAAARNTPVLRPNALRTARRLGVFGAMAASRGANGP